MHNKRVLSAGSFAAQLRTGVISTKLQEMVEAGDVIIDDPEDLSEDDLGHIEPPRDPRAKTRRALKRERLTQKKANKRRLRSLKRVEEVYEREQSNR